MPYAPVLVIELAGLGFALLAFGHGKRAPRPDNRAHYLPDSPKALPGRSGARGRLPAGVSRAPTSNTGPSGGQSVTREQAEADLITLLALGQSVPSQRTLAERWHRPKQTVSDWLREWERDGLIPARRQIGREKMLAASHVMRETV